MIHSAVVPRTDLATLLTSVRSSRESAAKKIQRGAPDALGVTSLAPCFLRLAQNSLGARPINVTRSPGFTPSLSISDLGLAIFLCHFSALGPRWNVNRPSFVRTCNSPSSTRTSLIDENGILKRAPSPRKIISEVSRRARPVEDLPLCVTVQLTSFPMVHPAKRNSARRSGHKWPYTLFQEGICFAFLRNRCHWPVTGIHNRVVRKLHQLVLDRGYDLLVRTAPKIGPPDTALKKCVAGEKLRARKGHAAGILGKVQRYATRRVPWRMNDARKKASPRKCISLFQQVVDFHEFRGAHAKERCLRFHPAVQGKVVTMHHHRRARVLMQPRKSADMVDMSVRADDCLHHQFVPA